jgi:hypothetical protein
MGEPRVGAPGITDGRHASREKPVKDRHCLSYPGAAWQRLRTREGDVRMAVDQPGNERSTTAVHAIVSAQAPPHGDDPIFTQQDVGAYCRTTVGVENRCPAEKHSCHSWIP